MVEALTGSGCQGPGDVDGLDGLGSCFGGWTRLLFDLAFFFENAAAVCLVLSARFLSVPEAGLEVACGKRSAIAVAALVVVVAVGAAAGAGAREGATSRCAIIA